MTSPARFTKGVTNAVNGTNMGQLIIPDPTSVHVFMDDFDNFDASRWLASTVKSSSVADGTITVGDADGGILAILPSAGDDDSVFLEYIAHGNTTATEIFTLESGKKLWAKARFKVSDTGDSDFYFGLKSADTTPLTAPVDGLWFQSDDGDDYLDFHVYASSAVVLADTNVHTCVDDTYLIVGMYYDGGTLHYFVNDAEVGSIAGTSLPSAALTISFGVQNGSASARTMSVDYVCVIKER